MDITFVYVLAAVFAIIVGFLLLLLYGTDCQTKESRGGFVEYYLEPSSCGGYYLMKRAQSTMSPDEPIKMVSSVEEAEEIISNMSRPIINLKQSDFEDK